MRDNRRAQLEQQTSRASPTTEPGRASGQALVEYALIATLVMIGIAAVLTVTGPTVGNIFSNTVYNLLGQKMDPDVMPASGDIINQAKTLDVLTLPAYLYRTNTPLIPTCQAGARINLWAPTVTGPNGLQGTYGPCPP